MDPSPPNRGPSFGMATAACRRQTLRLMRAHVGDVGGGRAAGEGASHDDSQDKPYHECLTVIGDCGSNLCRVSKGRWGRFKDSGPAREARMSGSLDRLTLKAPLHAAEQLDRSNNSLVKG